MGEVKNQLERVASK